MASFEGWIWVPDEKDMFLPAKVVKSFKPGEEGKAKLESGQEISITAKMSKECIMMDEAALKTYDNMISLNDLNEPVILHNLRQRFLKDEIYTYVSSILVALNPFKLLPIYTPEILDKYKDGGGRYQPPHIFAISDNAYRNLLAEFRDQAVVISGESGAGKTETMKLVLQFLAEASGRAQKQGSGGDKQESLEQQILKSNPLMEAFGNAKTTRNNNSSRFGKWTEIKFNRQGAIVGGSIINYLLEKSRIPFQAQQERNYHCFYQLLAGGELDQAMKKSYKLRDAEEFRYMNQSGVTTVDSINDEKDWLEMTNAMDVLAMTADEKEAVFRLCAALLQLGNLEFERDPKGTEETDAKVKNNDQLLLSAELLRVDGPALEKALTYKKISRPGSKSITYAHYSISKASDARDALSKALYGKLFDYLILVVNKALSGGLSAADAADKSKTGTIGVLDIFGFESFQTNSFEQLCINYCNEKLQFHFNEYIFKLEQQEYASEGIPVDMIEFKDNQPTLDMLEKKGDGIFAMIDEEINVPKGSDESLLKKVLAKHAKHTNFAAPKPKDFNAHITFIVIHYAGAVPYNVTGFLEKNRDALNDDIIEVIDTSKCILIPKLLHLGEEVAAGGDSKAKKKQPTLGFQFKESLAGLMVSLYKCEPHFVRCMKSNHQKKGNIFEADMMMAQLRYCGLLEVARIRKIGFPVRKKFDDFVFRYRCLDLMAATKGHKVLCEALEAKKVLKPKMWAIGHSKVFLKNQSQSELEEAREVALKDVVTKMTKVAKRFIARCRYARYKSILKALRDAISKRTEEALEAALAETPELPFGGGHLKLVKDARALKERLEEERRVTGLCTEAIKARELNELRNACKAADDITFDSPVVKEAKALLERVEAERKAVKRLKKAIEERNLDELTAGIEDGNKYGDFVTGTDTFKEASTLKARIEEENAARKAVKKAIKARELEPLGAGLAEMARLGMDGEDIYKEGVSLKEKLEEEAKAIKALADAIAERLLEPLQDAVKKAKKVGVPEDNATLVEGVALVKRLEEEKETEDELQAAAASREADRIEKALKKAKKAGLPDNSNGVRKCVKMLEQLKAEAEALARLKAALKANKAPALLAALNKCNELGMEGPDIDAAKDAMGKLGAQSEALLRLENAVSAQDLDGIDASLKELEKMGLGDEDVVKDARVTRRKVAAQVECAAAIEAALGARDGAALSGRLEEAEKLNLGNIKKYEELLEKARKLIASLEAEAAILKQLAKAVENNDEEAIDAAEAKADKEGASDAVYDEIKASRKKLGELKEFNKKLAEAMEGDPANANKELIEALIEEADKRGVSNAKVDAAKQLLNREENLKKVRKDLKKATKSSDPEALAAALQAAIACGLKGEELEGAKDLQKRLEEETELASGIKATMKALSVKADSKSGVTATDLKPLDKAMAEARANGLSDDSPFMQQALAAKERIEKVLVVQSEIAAALESESLRSMKKVLDKAEDLELGNSSLVKKLKAKVKELEKARSRAAIDDDLPAEAVPSLDDEEMKRVREEKLKKAAHIKFHFTKFARVRAPDDFAKGVLLNKKKVKAQQLRWQSSVIPTSILDFPHRELAKISTRIHKSILGYTGDKSMSFPATLAQDILQKGLELPDLVDEVYIQLCKHLTHNPRPESAVRGWQLMCMCVGTFPPSRDFENYLVNFILEHKDGAGAIGNYARYSLRRLEGIINSGPSGFVPSVEEIQAYKERPPILATIELVDGTPLTEDLPITPDLNVGKVLDICTHFMELQDPRMQYFGVFVEDIEDPDAPQVSPDSDDAPPYAGLPKTPRPLQNENFMGDVVTVKVRQNQPFKFVFKRKIFLKNLDGPSDDAMFERLIYLQAVDEVVKGNIPLDTEEEVALMTSRAMAIDLGDDGYGETAEELAGGQMMEYVPKPWREAKDATEWGELVAGHREAVFDADSDKLQADFVDAVRDHPLYGTCFFHVRKHRFPDHMDSYTEHVIIALNSEGLHFLNEERETLASFGYADIYRWGGSSTQFSIIIWNPESQDTDDVSMFTSQAADMASLILDYINAIMATTES